ITVLRDGAYIGTCAVSEVDQARLVEMMVGRRIENCFPPKPAAAAEGDVVLEVQALQLKRNGPVSRFQLWR
ncbi:sugar ABC transporter ATP-binding protein, partial [Salmonella enterica]